MDSKMIDKEFEKWLEVYKKEQGFIDEYDYPYKHDLRNTWNGCAELMQGKIKELEAEINQRDNEIKTIRAISNGMLKENEKLKKELDEATEIIKDEICKVWEKGCERRERAEQFLSSLDKPKEEL